MTLMQQLQMEEISVTKEAVVYQMPVNEATTQPFGFLHGGATAALAETVASVGAMCHLAPTQIAFGLELNINHLRSTRTGYVIATATPIHIGRSSHVWDVRVADEEQHLIAISRCTLAIKTQLA